MERVYQVDLRLTQIVDQQFVCMSALCCEVGACKRLCPSRALQGGGADRGKRADGRTEIGEFRQTYSL